jgi:hypothetical protein
MSILRSVFRGLLTSSVAAIALGGCSISFGSGSGASAPGSYNWGANGGGKPIATHNLGRVDDREKPLPGTSTDKPIHKAEGPHRKPVADPTPTRDEPSTAGPKRIKKAPKRTKPAATRIPSPTPREPVDASEPSRDGADRPAPVPRPTRSVRKAPTRRLSVRPTR